MSKSSPLRTLSLMCALIVSVSLLAGDLLGASKGTNRQETQDPPASAQTRPISAGTPADLSGTYTGFLTYPEGGIENQEATLTITGDRFTLTAGEHTYSGRLVATQWPGYIVVAMQMGEPRTPAPGEQAETVPTISARARRSGDRLTLTPAPGAVWPFSFTPTRAARMRGPRPRRGQRATPAIPAEPAEPTAPPPADTTDVTPTPPPDATDPTR